VEQLERRAHDSGRREHGDAGTCEHNCRPHRSFEHETEERTDPCCSAEHVQDVDGDIDSVEPRIERVPGHRRNAGKRKRQHERRPQSATLERRRTGK